MAIHTIVTRDVFVIGRLWMGGKAGCKYTLPKNIPSTREDIQEWLDTHAGDFQEVIDFGASIEEVEIPFLDQENEMDYWDISNPVE